MNELILDGKDGRQLMLAVLRPEDLTNLRADPTRNTIRVDGEAFGRPNIEIMISYAPKPETLPKLKKIKRGDAENFCFGAKKGDKTVMGIILVEPYLRWIEADPMGNYETFTGEPFKIPKFSLTLTYANKERQIIAFLRASGMSMQEIGTNPAFADIFRKYTRELVTDRGIEISPDEDVEVSFEKPAGFDEALLLRVRADELAWFATHPTENQYYRRAVPGEFPPGVNAEWVQVIKMDNEHRYRIPVNRVGSEFVEVKVNPADQS